MILSVMKIGHLCGPKTLLIVRGKEIAVVVLEGKAGYWHSGT
jgi:hypothetical protein